MAQNLEKIKKYPLSASDYKIYEEVGQGVSAIVHRALCIPFNEIVAIKVLDLEKCNSNLDEIRREAQTMSLINHANVLRAHCSFVADKKLWVVMPYMSGGSCLHIMKSVYPDGFEEAVIATILKEVLKALEYLHSHGHIHRDVKAGNILVDNSGAVKLGDFGVSACMFDTGDRQRSRNTFVGTPCWMAPEIMEQIHGYDFKADIWSFGITALELAHGHAPFSKYPPMKVLLMTLQNAPPGLDYERDRRFSKAFKEMIASCLVKDPTKRPSAEKLSKLSFFKHARSNEYLARTILDGLPPLGDRIRVLKEKELDRLAQKKMPYEEKEEISQNEYKRGISAWNFDLEDLKAQAALIKDDEELSAIKYEAELQMPTKANKDRIDKPSYIQSPVPPVTQKDETSEKDGDHVMRFQPGSLTSNLPLRCLNGLKGQFDIFDDDQCDSPTWKECQYTKSESGRTQDIQIQKGNIEKFKNDDRKLKLLEDGNSASTQGRKVLSGPLVPEHVHASYKLRVGDVNRNKYQNRSYRERNLSGPLVSYTAGDARSTDSSLGPKSSDSLEEKSRVPVVQQKGRFKVTSEDVDLEVVLPSSSPQRTQSSQNLSHTMYTSPQFPVASCNGTSIPVSSVLPQLQSILQQNTMQRDQIAAVMKYMSHVETSSAYRSSNLASKSTSQIGAEIFMVESSSDNEREHLQQISELQSRVTNLVNELQREKFKNAQLERQLNAIFNREEEDRIRREEVDRDIG
ncbi:serine/threonine-protein kinase BLUS1 isoform X1 [Cryptomeria japonica]|uniref:serine/threonine-protein kinase BLUS1 isoform X1 n=1 Tax=Cryptomeria japonica TaxID=3369 RepID=UPI0027DA9F61|nr:serine/threonine-protein kinase BLUS1 isoform X1 [Cryptomeria japonica]